jgi:hypothetical protein
VRAIIIQLRGPDLTSEMGQIRTWCKDHKCEPTSFKYHSNGNGHLIVIAEFAENDRADLFKTHFRGLESEIVTLKSEFAKRSHSRETMPQPVGGG